MKNALTSSIIELIVKSLLPILGVLIGFFQPLYPFIIGTILLVLSDVYTGVLAAKREGEVISSKRMKRKTLDVWHYCLAIILVHIVEFIFLPESILKHNPLTFSISFYIAGCELKSNLENLSRITGNDLWKSVSDKLKVYNPFHKESKNESN